MLVKLLQDITEEHPVEGGKPRLKVSKKDGKPAVPFLTGEVIEMSDSSAQKYISRGWAEPAWRLRSVLEEI